MRHCSGVSDRTRPTTSYQPSRSASISARYGCVSSCGLSVIEGAWSTCEAYAATRARTSTLDSGPILQRQGNARRGQGRCRVMEGGSGGSNFHKLLGRGLTDYEFREALMDPERQGEALESMSIEP